ncbi:MAG: DNA cytosine methyltransferase, partial [Thermoproteota archaeon]|nr:DNA cytosine methyltransferase [Thermoproteota archaeon]
HITRPNTKRDLDIYKIALEKHSKGRLLKYNELPKHLVTHQNIKAFLDRFKVVDSNARAAQTIVAHISKDGHHFIYPDKKQLRSLSVREAARLQTFPDSYKFEGSRTAQFKQIGNAVPPLFSSILAKELIKFL